MSGISHTLSVYKLDFSYMERNNPLKEELKEKIINKEKPSVDIPDYLGKLINECNSTNLIIIGNQAIRLSDFARSKFSENSVRFRIIPQAGKAGLPFTVFNKNGHGPYNFNSGSVSTYSHYMFIYGYEDAYYLVCHRRGLSGCKSLFIRAWNSVLKKDGIKIETNLIMPQKEKTSSVSYSPLKFILKSVSETKSTDVADQLQKTRKKQHIEREYRLSLSFESNSKIRSLLDSLKNGDISNDDALAEIKKEIPGSDYFNEAQIEVKIGSSRKLVNFEDFENILPGFDITDQMAELEGTEAEKIEKCSDDVINKIRGYDL